MVTTQNAINMYVEPGNLGSEYVFPPATGSVILSSYGSFTVEPQANTGSKVGAGWTHLKTFAMAAATAEQTYTVDTSYHAFMVNISVLKSASSASSAFGMRLNSSTGSGYKFTYIKYATTLNKNFANFELHEASTGTSNAGGTIFINRKEANSADLMVTGTVYGDDQTVWLGGRVDAGGDLTSIAFDDYVSDGTLTGSIVIWGIKNS